MSSEDLSAGGRRAPLRSPQLEELRTFCAAVELGGVGRAAQRLHVSQPSASKRLRALEQLVGTALLERSPRGVRMTPAGERLYARANRLVSAIEQLTGELEEIRGSGETVRLAISHTAAEYVMPKALVIMHRHTSAPVEVLTANSNVVKRMVLAGETDVGVAACMLDEVVEGAENVPLLDDEIVIAVPLGHPWARRASISPEELRGTPIVRRDPSAHTRQVIDATLSSTGTGPLKAACEVGSTQAAKEEAHELGLPTVLSRLAFSAADRLEIVPVRGLSFVRRFVALHQHGSLSTAATHLVEALRESAAALAGD
jgi:DNA-binding transcriptional LysR family regulator